MTQTHETPEEHSDLVGGSTAARRIHCPRSYALEKLVPKDPGSIYAREGTALHEMIAIILDKDKLPSELLPFTFKREATEHEPAWEFTVDEDLWADVGQPALDAFDQFADEIEADENATFEFEVETRCAMPGIDGAFGTSDIIWRCGNLTGIWDWKFGRTPVDAEENEQLMFYARAAASTMPHLFGPVDGVEGNDNAGKFGEIDPKREVVLSIMQPKCSDEPSEYIVTVEELEAFRVKLKAAVTEAVEQGDKARCEKGPWCQFATCKAVCPHWAGQSAAFGEKMTKLRELKDEQQVDSVEDVTVNSAEHRDVFDHPALSEVDASLPFKELLPELLDYAETVKGWADEIFSIAHRVLADGEEVEGWKLKDKRSSGRTWSVEEEEVKKFLKNRRYKLDEYMPRKLLTMPQTEKLLKRDGRSIPEEMTMQKPSSGTTLVRADHPAPAHEMSSDRAKALGDKLSALSGGEPEA